MKSNDLPNPLESEILFQINCESIGHRAHGIDEAGKASPQPLRVGNSAHVNLNGGNHMPF